MRPPHLGDRFKFWLELASRAATCLSRLPKASQAAVVWRSSVLVPLVRRLLVTCLSPLVQQIEVRQAAQEWLEAPVLEVKLALHSLERAMGPRKAVALSCRLVMELILVEPRQSLRAVVHKVAS
jgi:hypothetical protein